MLNVFISFDIEVWCDGWTDIDRKFPEAFQSYVYGCTPQGDYGLPFQLSLMADHGLPGVFFVEPLFALRFGVQPLAEVVGLLREARQEVQLHLHTEWVDEARQPPLPHIKEKRQHLRFFNRHEQTQLLAMGVELLQQAGAPRPSAFRAGSFAFNADTLPALRDNGIFVDSSYNASMFGPCSGVRPGELLLDATHVDGTLELPMTVFRDGTRRLRHAQVGACSSAEMQSLLWQALRQGKQTFVILMHNVDTLNRTLRRPDKIVVDRFRRLCAFLDKNRDVFNVQGMRGLDAAAPVPQRVADNTVLPLSSPIWRTGVRMAQQLYRRTYG